MLQLPANDALKTIKVNLMSHLSSSVALGFETLAKVRDEVLVFLDLLEMERNKVFYLGF